MSSVLLQHPDEERLLRYTDGELPPREAAGVRAHLEACWQCRTEVEELQRVVSECVRYRKAVAEAAPAPPLGWRDLREDFASLDAASGRAPAWLRFFLAPRTWAPVAAAIALACLIGYQLRYAPSVRAAQLLERAVAAADAQPAASRRIEIRSRGLRLTRNIGKSEVKAASEDSRRIEALFRSARYSWDDPLSARSYLSWRNGLADRRDEVLKEASGYRIRTTTESSEMVQATLKLRTDDLRPVEGTMRFRNLAFVEVSELPEEPVLVASAPAPVARRAPEGAATPAPAAAVAPATAAEELKVLAALHRLGADLGDPIEVTRSESSVLVTGVGLEPERQREIRDVLSTMPGVQLHFEAAGGAAPVSEQPASGQRITTGAADIQQRLEKRLGGRAAVEQLCEQLLETSEALMARAYALQRLAARFPAAAESGLSPADRELLKTMRREHARQLEAASAALSALASPALARTSQSAAGAPWAPADWQTATGELFHTARRAETLLGAVLGGASPDLSADEVLSRLATGLDELKARSQLYASRDW